MDLALVSDKPLNKITTKVGYTIVDVQMSEKYVFFVFNDNKLKIFEIESGNLIKEIETSANQIKLDSADRLVMFDSIKRKVYLYEQTGEFCKLEEADIPQSIEGDLQINRDQSNCLAFYNSTCMKYCSLD
jgi:hypothetical protein